MKKYQNESGRTPTFRLVEARHAKTSHDATSSPSFSGAAVAATRESRKKEGHPAGGYQSTNSKSGRTPSHRHSGLRAGIHKNTTSESGRSMVEMLGTLAIMGVLSVGAVAGYRWAIDKYNANEIINEVKKRAIVVSQQKAAQLPETLDEFESTVLNYPIGLRQYPLNEPYFMIGVDNIPTGVCTHIVNSDWEMPAGIYINNSEVSENTTCPQEETTLNFVFNDLLTGDKRSDLDDVQTCSESEPCLACDECILGVCYENCPENQICGMDDLDGDGKEDCYCPINHYLKDGVCTACPENSTTSTINATACECAKTYIWNDEKCVLCTDAFQNITDYNFDAEHMNCNDSCGSGQYAVYTNTNCPKNITVSCKKIDSIFDADTKNDSWYLTQYEKVRDNLGKVENIKKVFGETPTGAEIKAKVKELLGEKYYLPNYTYATWHSAQSWCFATGGKLISREEYFDNNEALLLITGFLADWNYNRYWATGLSSSCSSVSCPTGRSTRGQCGGYDSTDNSLWFMCKK